MKTKHRFFFHAFCAGIFAFSVPLFATPSHHIFGLYSNGENGMILTYGGFRVSEEKIGKILERIAIANPDQHMLVIPTRDVRAGDLMQFLDLVRSKGLRNVILISPGNDTGPMHVKVQPKLPDGVEIHELDVIPEETLENGP